MGEQVIHIGDAEPVKKLLNAEHDLVEGKAACMPVMLVRQVVSLS